MIWVNEYIDQWIEEWAPHDMCGQIRWHLLHDALGTQILLVAHIAKRRSADPASNKDGAVLLKTSTRLITEALNAPPAPHMTTRASMFPYVAAIVLKMSDRTDLVLRLALRMAGSPLSKQVPTCVWAAGRSMLAMLWLVPFPFLYERDRVDREQCIAIGNLDGYGDATRARDHCHV